MERLEPSAFVLAFAEHWRRPVFHDFVRHFCALLEPEARMVMPLQPVCFGPEGFRAQFQRVFTLFPDLSAEVTRSATGKDFARAG